MFIYTREAHPGEIVPEHHSIDDKLACARLLRDEVGIRRPILVDDLAGTVHRRYGLMPNMTWVTGKGGQVVYKANWTSAANVEAFLVRFLAGPSAVRSGGGVAAASYQTEQLEFRVVDRPRFMARLERNGHRAVTEFSRAQRMWARRVLGPAQPPP